MTVALAGVWFLVVGRLSTMVLTPRAGAQNRAVGELVWAWNVTSHIMVRSGEVRPRSRLSAYSLCLARCGGPRCARERMGNSRLAESWSESPDGSAV